MWIILNSKSHRWLSSRFYVHLDIFLCNYLCALCFHTCKHFHTVKITSEVAFSYLHCYSSFLYGNLSGLSSLVINITRLLKKKERHVTIVFVHLGCSTKNNSFQFHPFIWGYHNFIFLINLKTFYFINIPHFPHLFILACLLLLPLLRTC